MPTERGAVDPWAVLREIAGLTRTEIRERAERDRDRYHTAELAKERDYFCPGCWWCCDAEVGDPRARRALAAIGEDYL